MSESPEKSEKPISDIYFSQSAQSDAPMDESDGSTASPTETTAATETAPEDVATESAHLTTQATVETAPEDVATEPTYSTVQATPTELTAPEIYDESDGATAVSSETPAAPPPVQPKPQPTPAATQATNDGMIPMIIAASIADAFFNKEPPAPPAYPQPCNVNVTEPVPPSLPPLLLRDVQTDADLTALRAKYRNRYLELEEMLEYASATAKLDPLSLSLEVKKLKKIFFYESPDYLTVQTLCEAEADMEELYSELAQLIYPATIQTLRATSENYPVVHPWWSSWLLGSNSVGLNFFRQIFWVAIALLGVLFFQQYINFYIGQSAQSPTDFSAVPSTAQDSLPKTPLELFNRMLQVITPFLYGAIGSLIYIYKTLSDLYVSRTLDPNKLANNWMRLFMGSLMGGLTVALFYQSYFMYDTAGTNDKISAVALAFLTGYSVEFFYRVLDRAINVLVPKADSDIQGQTVISPRQQQMDTLLKRLKDAKSEDDKILIRSMLEKL